MTVCVCVCVCGFEGVADDGYWQRELEDGVIERVPPMLDWVSP